MSEISIINDKVDRVLDTQGEIFREIKDFRQEFSDQRVSCENRFTELEITKKVDTKWKHGISRVLYVFTGGSLTWVAKPFYAWAKTKLGF